MRNVSRGRQHFYDRSPRALVKAIIAAMVTAASALGADASPLIYNEAISGDLPATPEFAFLLEAGTSTVNGTVGLDQTRSFSGRFDGIEFVIPNGLQLESASVTFLGGVMPQGTAQHNLNLTLRNNVSPGVVGESLGTLAFTVVLGTTFLEAPRTLNFDRAAFPLAAGRYTATVGTGGGSSMVSVLEIDYVATFEVIEAIPEPGVAMLLGMGLAGIAIRKRDTRWV